MIGKTLGPYQVVAKLGEGGMGEVYRARDMRLNRDVAIKVLPEAFAADADRRARFEREAQAVAALSHPNILAIHDTGTFENHLYIVTELLDGESLRARLSTTTLPIRKAIDIAVQIARGLAAAHDKGIVHRDLKPENVFLLRDGQVKILDFGLAQTIMPAGDAVATETVLTDPGTVVGTVGYMAPEQIRGQQVDSRADLFALGAVLHEMLSGVRAFQRETTAETMTAILREDPPPIAPSANRPIPPFLLRIVDRCLEKSPAERFRSTADLVFALQSVAQTDSGVAQTLPASSGRRRLWWAALPWAVTAAIALAATLVLWRIRPAPTRRQVHLVISSPDKPFRTGSNWDQFALAADGSRIFYSLVPPGTPNGGAPGVSGPIYQRRLDEPDASLVPGTDGGQRLILSPDGKWLVFNDPNDAQAFKKVPVDGGPPLRLVENMSTGGTWGNDDRLILVRPGLLADADLIRLGATDKQQDPIPVRHDTTRGEDHYTHPQVLPDGSILLTILHLNRQHEVGVLPAGATAVTALIPGMHPRFIPPQYLIFARGSQLLAVTFDSKRLTLQGEPVPVLDGVLGDLTGGESNFSTSIDGSLAYLPGPVLGSDATSAFVLLDRRGQDEVLLPLRPQQFGQGKLSKDGKHLATSVTENNARAVSIGEVETGRLTRLSSEDSIFYEWFADGKRIGYVKGDGSTWSRPADASRAEEQLFNTLPGARTGIPLPNDTGWLGAAPWGGTANGLDILIRRNDDKGQSFTPWLEGPSNDLPRAFSPDGHWLLYASDTSGQAQLYIDSFPKRSGPKPVTRDGVALPVRWIGNEILYRQPGGGATATVMVAHVEFSPTPVVGVPQVLFNFNQSYTWDDVTSDGKRFLFRKDTSVTTQPAPPTELHVIVNWIEDVKARLARGAKDAR